MNRRPTKYKFRKFKKVKIAYEYALWFSDSNSMLDCVCSLNTAGITNSSLYTRNGAYQLVMICNQKLKPAAFNCAVFKDKLHIEEIKRKSRLICPKNAVNKIQRAFKAP